MNVLSSKKWSKILKLLLSILIIYLLIITLFYIFQRNVIYKPLKEKISPSITNITKVKEVKFKTKDGITLNSWYYLPKKDTVILYLHGNSNNIRTREPYMENYLKSGFGVFLLEYRGYGNNVGTPTEEGLYNDARAAVNFLKKQNIKPKDIIVLGESLGTAVAVQLATEYDFKGVILQSPFTSMVNVGAGKYPILPVNLLLTDKFLSINKIQKIKSPMLFIHGDKDTLIPVTHMKELYNKFPGIKYKKIYKGYGHSDLPDYSDVVIKFINNIKNNQSN